LRFKIVHSKDNSTLRRSVPSTKVEDQVESRLF